MSQLFFLVAVYTVSVVGGPVKDELGEISMGYISKTDDDSSKLLNRKISEPCEFAQQKNAPNDANTESQIKYISLNRKLGLFQHFHRSSTGPPPIFYPGQFPPQPPIIVVIPPASDTTTTPAITTTEATTTPTTEATTTPTTEATTTPTTEATTTATEAPTTATTIATTRTTKRTPRPTYHRP